MGKSKMSSTQFDWKAMDIHGNATLDIATVLKLNDISDDVQSHLVLVYSTLTFMMLSAVVGVFLCSFINIGGMIPFLFAIAMLFWMSMDQDKENFPKRFSMACSFGFFQGMVIAPVIQLIVLIDPTIVFTALLCTVAIFGCFSAAALISKRRSYLYLGGMLSSGLLMLAIIGIVNIFSQSIQLMWLHLYGGLVLFSAFVVYDTQCIIEKAANGSKDFAGHATKLFLDFVSIFIRILAILMRKGKSKSNNFSNQTSHQSHVFDL
jgi:FtsH-binding integral membrane protein